MLTARSVTALLLSTVLAGCTAQERHTTGPPPPPPSTSTSASTSAPAGGGVPSAGHIVDCANAVARVADPGETYRVVADVIAVPAVDRVLEPEENTSGEGPTRLFAKWGLLVRTGATVELSLAPEWGERARIRWGGTDAEPGLTVTVTACTAAAGEGPWSVFTGGTWVIEPDCVPIEVKAGTVRTTVELSIGTPCSRPGG